MKRDLTVARDGGSGLTGREPLTSPSHHINGDTSVRSTARTCSEERREGLKLGRYYLIIISSWKGGEVRTEGLSYWMIRRNFKYNYETV